ncbi:ABC transporter permease [Patescibacteria group bacterium]
MGNWLKDKKYNKYLTIFKISWQNTFVYRLSFLIWRLESVILFFVTYLFWFSVYRFNQEVGNYNEQTMLTYIIGSAFLRALVLQSKNADISGEIGTGSISSAFLKPISYFGLWFSRDLSAKALNLIFFVFEFGLIILFFQPTLFIQTNILNVLAFLLFSFLGLITYFYLSLLISLTTFWYPEHNGWPARFLFSVVIDYFLSGGLLPLDVLPKTIFSILKLLPSTYIRFFPIQIYLGRVENSDILLGFLVSLFWLFVLRYVVKIIWSKGIKRYDALGI